jgi:hypothetical protein
MSAPEVLTSWKLVIDVDMASPRRVANNNSHGGKIATSFMMFPS